MNTTTTLSPCSLDIGIGGMTCASCVMRVEKALKKVPGVQDASVNLATESARIVFAQGEQMEALLRRAVRDAGYEPRTSAQMDQAQDASPWAGFAPVAIGLLLCAPLVLPMVGAPFGRYFLLPAWLQFALSLPWPPWEQMPGLPTRCSHVQKTQLPKASPACAPNWGVAAHLDGNGAVMEAAAIHAAKAALAQQRPDLHALGQTNERC